MPATTGLATLAMQVNKICVVVDICGKNSLDLDFNVQTAYDHGMTVTGPCHCPKALVWP